MKTILSVEHMQCSHCVSTINNSLLKINGIYGIQANIAAKQLVLDHTPEVDLKQISMQLKELGYPLIKLPDKFQQKATVWDANPQRRAMAQKFVRLAMENIPIPPSTVLMDFGCGTGLVGLQFAPYVKSLVMVDNSSAMLEVLKGKVAELNLNPTLVKYVFPDINSISQNSIDVIVSSMTLHHIVDTQTLFAQMYAKLKPGGYLAVADLVKEDGRFHKEAVPHNGFDQHELCEQLNHAGFQLTLCEIYNKIKKETQNDKMEEFPQFIIIAKK